jgi:feruloyl-CoA synthase
VQDAVITGLNLNEIGALLVATPDIRSLAGLPESASMEAVAASAPVKAWLQDLVNRLSEQATGSATRVARALLLTEPPSMDKGEITDKGSLNQRAVLKHRAALVEALHAGTVPHIATPQKKGTAA